MRSVKAHPYLRTYVTLYKVLFCKVLYKIAFLTYVLLRENLDMTQFVFCKYTEDYKILFDRPFYKRSHNGPTTYFAAQVENGVLTTVSLNRSWYVRGSG